MRYFTTTAYWYNWQTKDLNPKSEKEWIEVGKAEVYLYHDEIHFIEDLGKTVRAGEAFKCQYFYSRESSQYPNSCNAKVVCEGLSVVLLGILYLKIDYDKQASFHLTTRRYWFYQTDFQQKALVAMLSGMIGGLIVNLILRTL